MSIWDQYTEYASPIAVFPLKSNTSVKVTPDYSVFEFEGMASAKLYAEPDFAGIAQHYGLEYKGGGERVSVLKNLDEVKSGSLELKLAGVTSVDVAADKKNLIHIPHLALIGAMHTTDERLIIGERGRRYGQEFTEKRVRDFADGCRALTPGGALTFASENPLDYTLEHEGTEENGLTRDQILNRKILSVFYVPKTKKLIGPSGLKIVEYFEVPFHSDEIIDMHEQALERYHDLCKEGLPKDAVAEKLEQEGLPKDIWEHTKLVAIDFDKKSILDFVDKIPRNEANLLEHQLCGIGVGALLSVADAL
jgi:hypothetical protein